MLGQNDEALLQFTEIQFMSHTQTQTFFRLRVTAPSRFKKKNKVSKHLSIDNEDLKKQIRKPKHINFNLQLCAQ